MNNDHFFAFEKLRVWQESRVWVKSIYQITRSFPDLEKFGLASQINRAVVSIPTNIAEGSGRTSAKDQAHFTQLAYSSLMESLNLLIIAFDQGYLTEASLLSHRNNIQTLSIQLNALHQSQRA